MSCSCAIVDWFALAVGLDSKEKWQDWASKQHSIIEQNASLPKYKRLPMMTARRMSTPSLLAVETALAIFEKNNDIEAAVFVSRHGEVERTTKIIQNFVNHLDVSPTDFSMSVHNTAAGLFSIAAKQEITITSLSAGADGFQQAMYEVQCLLSAGFSKVLLVDFDGVVPALLDVKYSHDLAYAMGLLLTKGKNLSCQVLNKHTARSLNSLPLSLEFLKNYLNGNRTFNLSGEYASWQWNQCL